MATSYTSLLGLALPVTGELAGTWGDTVNNAITSLLDTAIAGTTTLSADTDVTLTTTTGASNQARQAILLCSGARTALRTITAPAQSKIYVVINNTTGGYGVKLVGAGPTTGVTVAAGKTAVLVWNGSDFIEVAPATATTATNLAGGAAGSVPYQSGANATTFLSLGTAAQVLQVNAGATAPEWVSSTGTGNVVRASSPTLTTPTLGVASATSINKVAITSPATGSTLTIADGKTLTASNTLTFTGTDSSSVAFGTGGTVAYTSNNLSVFAATTSAQLAGVISDETGSGALVFGTSPTLATPTFTTSATFPLHIGGTGTTSTLTLRSTSGVGTTGADIIFQTGNNGATEAMRILNNGRVGIGTNAPSQILHVVGSTVTDLSGTASATAVVVAPTANSNFFTVKSSLAASAGLRLSANAADDVAAITNFYNAALTFGTNNAERMRIDSSGRVLITGGTTTGLVKQLNVYSAAEATVLLSADSTGEMGVSFRDQTAGSNWGGIQAYNNSGSNRYIVFSNGGEKMRIDSSGNLLVGSTALAAAGSAGIQVGSGKQLILASGNADFLSNLDAPLIYASATGGGINFNGHLVLQPRGSAAGAILFATGNGAAAMAERMRIDSAGNVAIGGSNTGLGERLVVFNATSPTAIFRLTGGTNNPYLLIRHTETGAISTIDVNSASAAPQLTFALANAEKMRIDSSGNVGIGTASPGSKLDVNGNTNITGTLTATSNVSATNSWLFVRGNSVAWPSIIGQVAGRMMLAQTNGNSILALHDDTAVAANTGPSGIYFTGRSNDTGPAYLPWGQISGFKENATQGNGNGYMQFKVSLSGTGLVERMRIDSAGNVGIGTASPAYRLDVSGGDIQLKTNATYLRSVSSGGSSVRMLGINAADVAYVGPIDSGPTAVAHSVASTVTSQAFYTGNTERMRIDSSGNVLVTGAGGLGYGTGSGGAVTQATSRTTGVTLNKTNGAITLVSAAGSATYQTFTVTNSTVAATDVIHVCQKSGTDKYIILVTAVAAGSFDITFATTGGTTTEQPVFNFAVLKAVTA